VAWLGSFGNKNGTDTVAEMTPRIESTRRRAASAIRRRAASAILAHPADYKVGCIMISHSAFALRRD